MLLRRNVVVDIAPRGAVTPAAVPEDELPVLAFGPLLDRTGTGHFLEALRTKLGFPPEMFEVSVGPVIVAFAEFVQMLPASESHHHAEPGGLLIHALEVASLALDYRRGEILPRGAPPETIGEQAHRWTYVVFVAALLHDVGKPIADLRVVVRNGSSKGEPWLPLAGSMLECGASSYRVEFAERGSRRYQLHGKFPVLLLNRFVPARILGWLSTDSALVLELFAYLSGDKEGTGGALSELVSRADAESVRRNLIGGSRVRFASARRVPLIERLMHALRAMLQEGGRLPLNRSGACGWVFEGAVWFVSKRVADEVRTYLESMEPLEDRIPGDNQRLFDTWQEYGAAVSNPETGGVVWDVTIVGPSYRHLLTVVRFPLAVLFERPEAYPLAMQGRIEFPEHAKDTAGPERITAPEAPVEELGTQKGQESPAEEYLEAVDEGKEDEAGALNFRHAAPMLRPPVQPAWTSKVTRLGDGAPEAAVRFMSWVQEGLASGELRFNESGALIHFVPEGMLLVSPRIFREFAKLRDDGGAGRTEGEDDASLGKGVQKQLLRAAWHVKADKGINILTYQVVKAGRKISQLSGVVIEGPGRFVNPVPPANPVLVRAAPIPKESAT